MKALGSKSPIAWARVGTTNLDRLGIGSGVCSSAALAFFQSSLIATILCGASILMIILATRTRESVENVNHAGLYLADGTPASPPPPPKTTLEWKLPSFAARATLISLATLLLLISAYQGFAAIKTQQSWAQRVIQLLEGTATSDELAEMEARTRAENAAMEARLFAKIEESKISNEDPSEIEWPPELLEQARVLAERGTKEQKAVAAIALRNHDEADRIIQELMKDPINDSFRFLMLQGDNWYQANEPDKAIDPYEKAMAIQPNNPTARINTVLAYTSARLGDITTNQRRAIDIAEQTASLVEHGSVAWAVNEHNLGCAWLRMPTGDPTTNLNKAINAIEHALTVYSRKSHPTGWAAAQINLGAAWSKLPTGDRAANIANAIDAYTNALTVYTKDVHPAEWAKVQNNLGNAWTDLTIGDRTDNLRRAIDAYNAALSVNIKDAFPEDWALTKNNLGTVWMEYPTGDRSDNLLRAIDAFEAALTVRTIDADPVGWATTQNNLGGAWLNLQTGVRADNMQLALDAFSAALSVRTKEADPIAWAMTQHNLGTAWLYITTGDQAENLQNAIGAFESALSVRARDTHPIDWAMTQNNLGIALANLSTGDRSANYTEALDAFEAALNVFSRDAHPEYWASTVDSISTLTYSAAHISGISKIQQCFMLRESIRFRKAALTIFSVKDYPRKHEASTHMLAISRDAYESAGCADQVPFDDIPPAE